MYVTLALPGLTSMFSGWLLEEPAWFSTFMMTWLAVLLAASAVAAASDGYLRPGSLFTLLISLVFLAPTKKSPAQSIIIF